MNRYLRITGTQMAVVRVEAGKSRLEYPPGTLLYEKAAGKAREIAFADTTKLRAPAQWSADGRSLYAVEPAFGAPLRIFRIDVATGAETLWKELQPPEPTGVAVIPEVVITPDGKSYAYSFTQMLGDLYLAKGLN